MRQISCPRLRSRAFSLIELLVVTAIISILLAMVLPALQKARALSKRVACAARFKQCGLAILSYAADYNRRLPSNNELEADAYKNGTSVDLRVLKPYLGGSLELWRCASIPNALPIDDSANTATIRRCNFNYFPGWTSHDVTANVLAVPTRLTQLVASEPLMSDLSYHNSLSWRANHSIGGRDFLPYTANPSLRTVGDGYPEGANQLRCDGSLAWYRASEQIYVGGYGTYKLWVGRY